MHEPLCLEQNPVGPPVLCHESAGHPPTTPHSASGLDPAGGVWAATWYDAALIREILKRGN